MYELLGIRYQLSVISTGSSGIQVFSFLLTFSPIFAFRRDFVWEVIEIDLEKEKRERERERERERD